jgi:glycosyltransferase involved in cell wall biosynthesis
MTDVVVVVDKFPQLSETFIRRQVTALGSSIICRAVDARLLAQLPAGGKPVRALESGVSKVLLVTHQYLLKLGRRLFNTASYYWPWALHRRFGQYLAEMNLPVVLAHFGPVGINCLVQCRRLGLPLIVHFHGYDATGVLVTPRYRRDLKALFAYASKVVAVSNKMKEDLVGLACPPEKIAVIPCGVPLEEFRPARKRYDGRFHFLFVGRLIAVKAPLTLIKAFELCADGNSVTRLTIIGDGPLVGEVRKYVAASRHRDRIHLMGAQPLAVVKERLAEAHAYVQHNVTGDYGRTEGWPVAIAEACASGLPVVATAHAGINDQVVHGETGYLVAEGDYAAMARYMLELSTNPGRCEQMGRKSREYIEKYGSFDVQLGRLAELLASTARLKPVEGLKGSVYD